jgi:hypothetical protein
MGSIYINFAQYLDNLNVKLYRVENAGHNYSRCWNEGWFTG